MNDHYEKVFDAISTVHHNKNDKQVGNFSLASMQYAVLA